MRNQTEQINNILRRDQIRPERVHDTVFECVPTVFFFHFFIWFWVNLIFFPIPGNC